MEKVKKEKKEKKKLTGKEKLKKIFSLLFTMFGLCLLFYPWISDYVNRHVNDSKVDTYQQSVKDTNKDKIDALLKEAREYNKTLLTGQIRLTEPFEESTIDTWPYVYEEMLSVDGSDVMGTVKIPKIDVNLPIYHGTSKEVLEKGVGHLKGSSLPVGGKDTHAVLTGHTGLTNAKLFTDLTEMEKGDLFFIHVLNLDLAYKVVDISVVVPEDTSKLMVVPNQDLVTLVTCTPYGVNSHRLLVRGERTKYVEKQENTIPHINPTKSIWMRSYLIALLIGLAIVAVIVIIVLLLRRRKKKKNGQVPKVS